MRVDRRKIGIDNIKRIGRYDLPIDLFEDVRVDVKTLVAPEGGELPSDEELEAMEAAERASRRPPHRPGRAGRVRVRRRHRAAEPRRCRDAERRGLRRQNEAERRTSPIGAPTQTPH